MEPGQGFESPEFTIRRSTTSDIPAIESVARVTWGVTYKDIIRPEVQDELLGRWYAPSALEQTILRGDSWLYVAEAMEQVVGFAQFAKRRDDRGELVRIYILPQMQGKGIGGRLMEAGLDSLLRQKVQEVVVQVEKNNQNAIGFYEHNGFRRVREYNVELPGQLLAHLEYMLVLKQRYMPG